MPTRPVEPNVPTVGLTGHTDGGKDPRLFRPPALPNDIGATLIVPLHARGETVGSMTIAKRRGRPMFLASDVTFMKTFAAHATRAITDARQQERLRLLRVLGERERMADSLRDNAVKRLYSVGPTLHVLLQNHLPQRSASRGR